METSLVFVAAILFVSGNAAAPDSAADQPPAFTITTRRQDDRVRVHTGTDGVLFDIESPFGISQAVIERGEAAWPTRVQVRLHLKGLSKFQVSHGKLRLDGTLAIHAGKQEVRQWQNGKENEPLTDRHALWMDMRFVEADGVFLISMPRALVADNPRTLTLHWIDFYR